MTHAFAESGYAGHLVDWTSQKTHITLQIIRRNASTKGFRVLPRRRFLRDYARLTTVAEP
ncbi:MAG: hypothetical protein ACRYG8_11650 [Janthinobacterium lividum]